MYEAQSKKKTQAKTKQTKKPLKLKVTLERVDLCMHYSWC